MAPSEQDLPAQARSLLAKIDELADEAARIKDEANEDLDEIHKRGAEEVRKFRAECREREEEADRVERTTQERRRAFEAMVRSRLEGAARIADAWADYERARTEAEAVHLEVKDHPARSAAETVRQKGEELARARRRATLAEYTIEFYEWHFPWLVELRDVDEGEGYTDEGESGADGEATQDPVRDWLTKEEFSKLSSANRSQRALDRYLKSRHSPWQLGRDYERYIGYLREEAGCDVTYHGIFKGFEDLGRDVLAEKDGVVEVIQCKRWAQNKTIHEKHVFQLYGTVVLARLQDPKKAYSGTFTTTTSLSPTAHEVADYLDIRVEEQLSLADYPRIKCNVARERRAHLSPSFRSAVRHDADRVGARRALRRDSGRGRGTQVPPRLALAGAGRQGRGVRLVPYLLAGIEFTTDLTLGDAIVGLGTLTLATLTGVLAVQTRQNVKISRETLEEQGRPYVVAMPSPLAGASACEDAEGLTAVYGGIDLRPRPGVCRCRKAEGEGKQGDQYAQQPVYNRARTPRRRLPEPRGAE